MVFDFNKFKEKINDSDLLGLEYLEETIIKDFKEEITLDYTRADYIINLFYATKKLNECIFIHEQTKVKNDFNVDIYHNTRDLLFKELGFDLQKIWE